MDAAQLDALMEQHFPQAHNYCQIIGLSADELSLRTPCRPDMLRPGGTISGPALMGLAEPAAHDVLESVRMLKLGKQLAVCEVHMASSLDQPLIAQATVTYSLPPASLPTG